MSRRQIYPTWDDFSKDDEYVYCDDDWKTFQHVLETLEKKTTQEINTLLQKHGFVNHKVEFFDIEDTEMDEDGYDIHAVISLNGRGISTSKLQHIEFILTGDVTLSTEEFEYMGYVHSRMESPPYETGYIEEICPQDRLTTFELDDREYSFSLKNFYRAIDDYLLKKSKNRRTASLDRVRKKRANQISRRRKSSGGCNCRKK